MKQIIIVFLSTAFSLFSLSAFAQWQDTVLSIHLKDIIIEGSLRKQTNQQPLALIIAGSGPTDRNGNNTALHLSTNTYVQLADSLAAHGIASFRYDKRGIGKSALPNFDESKLKFNTYVEDAKHIFHYLKDSLHFQHLFVIGHSEGALIGTLLLQEKNANGFISLSGAGKSIDSILINQLTKQQLPTAILQQVDSMLYILKQGKMLDTVPPYLYALFRPSIQPFMIEWLQYHPAKELSRLKLPILIIQGTCDIQISLNDAYQLKAANSNAQLEIINGMTHTLKNAGNNCKNQQATYTNATLPLDANFVQVLVGFIQRYAFHK